MHIDKYAKLISIMDSAEQLLLLMTAHILVYIFACRVKVVYELKNLLLWTKLLLGNSHDKYSLESEMVDRKVRVHWCVPLISILGRQRPPRAT